MLAHTSYCILFWCRLLRNCDTRVVIDFKALVYVHRYRLGPHVPKILPGIAHRDSSRYRVSGHKTVLDKLNSRGPITRPTSALLAEAAVRVLRHAQ